MAYTKDELQDEVLRVLNEAIDRHAAKGNHDAVDALSDAKLQLLDWMVAKHQAKIARLDAENAAKLDNDPPRMADGTAIIL